MHHHHRSRASLAEQRRLDAEQARSEHANSSVARTLRLVAQWEAVGLTQRAARILADQGVDDLSELRRNRTWPKAAWMRSEDADGDQRLSAPHRRRMKTPGRSALSYAFLSTIVI
jgi:hypothetical protein